MSTAVIIYFRAYGIYALISLPAILMPLIYIISLFYAFVYGLFACITFCLLYVITMRATTNYYLRMLWLTLAVPACVAFAFHMIEVSRSENNVWNSGIFLLFPAAATVAGWISLGVSAARIKNGSSTIELDFEEVKTN